MTFKHLRTSVVVVIGVVFAMSPRTLAAQSAPVILTSPDETPGQFSYAFADPTAPSDGQWVVIDFHRDPHCAEIVGFNLLLFVDFPDASTCELVVDVKEWWTENDLAAAGGPWESPPWSSSFRVPTHARWLGRGAVPIYFVNLLEYLDAIGDDVLTVDELESLPSLLVGHATMYQYIQINSGRANSLPDARAGHSQTVAHGGLNDGRTFSFERNSNGPNITALKIEFK